MVFYKAGDKIECEHSEVIAKDIKVSAPQKHPEIGLSLKYKCKRDGTAEITKELDPKEAIVDEKSNLNNGDKLNANSFYVLVKNIRKIKPSKIGGHTGRHSSQKMNTRNFTYAEITKPYAHIQNALESKKKLEE